jgi:hypothetical protein
MVLLLELLMLELLMLRLLMLLCALQALPGGVAGVLCCGSMGLGQAWLLLPLQTSLPGKR